MKQIAVYRVPKNEGEADIWCLICHLVKSARFKDSGVVFYRAFEFKAEGREEAERKAFDRLRELALRLTSSKFSLIALQPGRYVDPVGLRISGELRVNLKIVSREDVLVAKGPEDIFGVAC